MLDEIQIVEWLKLGRITGLGPIKLQRLVEIFGDVDKVYNASSQELLDTRIIKEKMLNQLLELKNQSDVNYLASIRECASEGIEIVTLSDIEYPLKLKRMPYPPLTLYLWGNRSLLETKKIAVVGTRQPHNKAVDFAYNSSRTFAENGFTVISGGAEGIDTAAHKGALSSKNGRTICVCPTGFFHPFPLQNKELFYEIRSDGLLISEHLPKFTGSRFSFIQRNRIISGLSDAVLVCASGEKGGSMVQTRIAREQCIPLFCPAIDMNLQPNAGIMTAIRDYGAQEIHTSEELLARLKSRGKSLDSFLR